MRQLEKSTDMVNLKFLLIMRLRFKEHFGFPATRANDIRCTFFLMTDNEAFQMIAKANLLPVRSIAPIAPKDSIFDRKTFTREIFQSRAKEIHKHGPSGNRILAGSVTARETRGSLHVHIRAFHQ
jgi:hypothetical protein